MLRITSYNVCYTKLLRSGQEKLFGYFVGQVMKATAGKANPKQVNDVLKRKLRG